MGSEIFVLKFIFGLVFHRYFTPSDESLWFTGMQTIAGRLVGFVVSEKFGKFRPEGPGVSISGTSTLPERTRARLAMKRLSLFKLFVLTLILILLAGLPGMLEARR